MQRKKVARLAREASTKGHAVLMTALYFVVALASISITARATDYPDRPLRLVVPFAPGGINDVLARLVAERAQSMLGQPIVVENRPGANGNLGAAFAAKAGTDGYTLALLNSIHALNMSFTQNPGFDLVTDFVPIAELGTTAAMIVGRPDFDVGSIPALIERSRSKPGSVTAATGGSSHAIEWLKAKARIDVVVVLYRGIAPALTDVMAGQVDMSVGVLGDVLPYLEAGRLRALAVAGPQRLARFPDLPTVAETLPGYDLTQWYGIFAPTGTPAPIVSRLREALGAAASSPEFRRALEGRSFEPAAVDEDHDAFVRRIADETDRWRRLVRDTGIKLN